MKNKPKDLNRSIRDKYKRRLVNLALEIENYSYAANERLNNGGNIKNRKETEEILHKVKELQKLIPEGLLDFELSAESYNGICEALSVDKITEEEYKSLQN